MCHEWIITNEVVHSRAGIERQLTSRANHRVLRKFDFVERMYEYRMARPRYRADRGWALGSRGLTVEAARQCVKNMKELRALVYM